MNEMSARDLEQHVTILGWLYIIGNAIFLAVGGFVFFLLTGIGVASGDSEAVAILGTVGTAVGLLLGALAVPGMVAGYGLLKRRPWARVVALVVGILGLVNFPLGTAIGAYTFWVLTQHTAVDYFDRLAAT